MTKPCIAGPAARVIVGRVSSAGGLLDVHSASVSSGRRREAELSAVRLFVPVYSA